ncbi:serine/threonine protein kinase [Methylovulum psychrotolerans]|uniref:Serine/threonine protein kinase n=1 Tax=Methylovulum psychrotolerans TaxID=1704499 RepID=A0A2S5CLH0_9GAMM|nr:serine/threonine-protein kinase [Methylovulum psychrotolerans]POZ51607.1 serine/threonine protein kinase [Methylovulum psychrotolerans]
MVIKDLDDLCMGCMSINKTASVCPECGFDKNTPPSAFVLPYQTILNKKFLIGRVLGKGGFGITYLAWDLVLQTAVAIKEYMPSTLVGRENKRLAIVAHSPEDQTEFEYGLKQFLQEARTLAQFSHANVVRVREFFPANNTAYLVMDYYRGVSLQQFLQQKNQKLTEEEALKIMLPVLNGLGQVHKKGFLHRDIKPDNIYLVDKEHPVLLDFGAARSAFSQKSLSLSVILTPGFAPFEQYLSRSHFTPSTDIYSVAATIYYMVSGVKPHEATARLQNDPMKHLEVLEPGLSPQFTKSIMLALEVYPEKRPQTIEEFEKQLTEKAAAPPPPFVMPHAPAYKPAHKAAPPPPSSLESAGLQLDLAPLDNTYQGAGSGKYETYYCPHCQTKNLIREGKTFADVKCIKCRRSPNEKTKKRLPLVTSLKIGAVILVLLVAYRFITSEVLTNPTVQSLVGPLLSDSGGNSPAPYYNPPETVRPSAPPTRVGQLLPPVEGLPRVAPPFAITACEGKSVHDKCVANSPRRTLAGICEEVRGRLACIPSGPDH